MKKLILVFGISLLFFTSCKEKNTAPEIISVDNTVEKKEISTLADASISKAEFTIKGMTCQIGCAATIEKKLAKMEGVKSAKVSFEKELAVVEFDTNSLKTDDLVNTVTSAASGDIYSVEELKVIE